MSSAYPKRVVITGIGAVSPNGIGREAFWRATRDGVSGIDRIQRFDTTGLNVQIAGEVRNFEEEAWVTPKDRAHVSRVVPLGVAAISEALEDAAIEPQRLSREQLQRIAVIAGTGGASQEWTEGQYRMYYEGHSKQCSVYVIPSSTPGTLSSEFSMRFGFRGLSHVVTTGCTSSTDAIGYSLLQLQRGHLDYIITGGVDAPIAPLILRGFQLMRIMTARWNHEPESASRPFSRDRDGFVLSEGAWFFVLETLDHALAREAHIYGEICGYGSTCEAFHRVRLDECGEEPARAIGMALGEAGIAPEAVGYIQYHGTSTELNDRIETRAVKLAFGSHAGRLPGSSLKSLIGHPQGACGAAGIAATLLGMRDGVAHATINLKNPDPQCDLDYVAGQSRKLDFEYAVANCIAFGSKNSAIVLRRMG